MNLLKLNETTFIDPLEIVSIEYDATFKNVGGASDACMVKDFDGTRLTLKNGRKVFIHGMHPSEVVAKVDAFVKGVKDVNI